MFSNVSSINLISFGQMKFLKYPFWILYRIWFYFLVTVPIILLFPVLVVSILKEEWYPYYFRLARLWAKIILVGMGFRWIIETKQIPESGKSYMFIANHTSMADIMLMLVSTKNPFVFVGKAELAKFPIFGFFYKRTCILVDRNSEKSKQAVFLRAQKRLRQGLSICIFPEGGVPDEDIVLDEFKDGAFRLAISHHIPIVPITFADSKERFSYVFFSGGPGRMRVKVHQFLGTEGMTSKDAKDLKEQARLIIHNQLLNYYKE